MAQHDYDINSTDSISGFQFRQDTNNALAAIKSTNSGAVAPTSPVAGMLWLDTSTTPNVLKVRDTANSAWLDIYVEAKMGTTIASAATIAIGNYGSGEVVHISGTATISALGASRIGTRRVLVFDAVATLVHSASAIICPGATSIACSLGTVVTVVCEGGSPSAWRVVDVVHPSVSYTEFGYLDGVTSSIQTQLNSKQATITGAATTIDTENLPVSMALVSDISGKVATHGTVSSTELGYLDGVTSGVQGQLGTKAPTDSPTFTGVPIAPTAPAGTNNTQIATTEYVDSKMVLGTAVDTISGTFVDFIGIPSWVKRITVVAIGISTNSTGIPMIQLGTSSGMHTSGYKGAAWAAAAATNNSNGFLTTHSALATDIHHFTGILTKVTNTVWAFSVAGGYEHQYIRVGGGSVTLPSTLDRVRITTHDGASIFDAGLTNILYEG